MSSYRVTAPLVLAKDQEGKTHHRYHGAVIEWLSPEQAKHFLETGFVERLGSAQAEEGAGGPGADPAKPKQVAPKADWVKFAVDQGADPVEAEALTKPELIELYGG